MVDTRRDLVGNALVLIAPAQRRRSQFSGSDQIGSEDDCARRTRTVPAGMYAQQTLEHMGLCAAQEKKAVYAKDVRQVLTYVETGTRMRDWCTIRTRRLRRKSGVQFCSAEYTRSDRVSRRGTEDSKNTAAARAFLEFLEAPARAVFRSTVSPPRKNQPERTDPATILLAMDWSPPVGFRWRPA